MADRKQTPDVLSEVLGAGQAGQPEPSAVQPATESQVAPPSSGRKPATRRASSRRKAEPPRWEYREILFRDYGGLRPRFVDGEEQEGWKRLPVIQEYLNQLGEEGWELAGVGSRHKDQVPFYFKRRRE
jgi:hypothetical protein